MKKKYGNFSFSHDIILKHNYIVVTFISLSLVNLCQKCSGLYLCFKDPQCIVSQEDFQHKILNWSTLLPLLSLHKSRDEIGGRNYENCLELQKQQFRGVA